MHHQHTQDNTLKIIPICAFLDNYIWLLHNDVEAIVIDPGDAAPVLASLAKLKLQLTAILITHHHSDHIDGVADLLATFPNAQVYAPKFERFNFNHHAVAEPDALLISLAMQAKPITLNFNVLDVPGHTLGHIAYVLNFAQNTLLFCGDTLFGAGCGRLFEGTPLQILNSLKKLSELPADTEVYCTHEYTLHNLQFALGLEPNNAALIAREQNTRTLIQQGEPSLPSSMALELATNPFLRCTQLGIQQAVQLKNANELSVFTKIRELRNHF